MCVFYGRLLTPSPERRSLRATWCVCQSHVASQSILAPLVSSTVTFCFTFLCPATSVKRLGRKRESYRKSFMTGPSRRYEKSQTVLQADVGQWTWLTIFQHCTAFCAKTVLCQPGQLCLHPAPETRDKESSVYEEVMKGGTGFIQLRSVLMVAVIVVIIFLLLLSWTTSCVLWSVFSGTKFAKPCNFGYAIKFFRGIKQKRDVHHHPLQ